VIRDSLVSTDQFDSTILRFFEVGRSENRLLNRRGYQRTHEKKEMYYSVLQGKYPSTLLSTGVSQWPDFLQFAPHSVNCFYPKRMCFLFKYICPKTNREVHRVRVCGFNSHSEQSVEGDARTLFSGDGICFDVSQLQFDRSY